MRSGRLLGPERHDTAVRSISSLRRRGVLPVIAASTQITTEMKPGLAGFPGFQGNLRPTSSLQQDYCIVPLST
jgi:hypothetical protein